MRAAAALGEEFVQHAEGHLTLGVRALVDGGNDRTRAQVGNEVGEKVGGDDGQAIEQVRVFSRFQHGNGSFRGHVDSGEVSSFIKELATLAIGFLLEIVIFDGLERLQVRIEILQGGFKGRVLFSVLSNVHVEDGDRDRSGFAVKEASHEIGGNGAAGQSVDGDHTQASTLRRIGGDTDHMNVRARGAPDGGTQGLRAAGRDDDTVHLIVDSGFQSFVLAFSQDGAGAEFQLDIFQQDGFGFIADAGANFIPEGSSALRSINRYAEGLFRGEISGREIRAIPEGSGNLQDSGFGRGAYARIVVQGAMDGSN